jgi:hypothetical protein
MDIAALEKIITDLKNGTDIELELKYNKKINKEDFDKILNFYKKEKLELTETTTLDINFIYNKLNYRITIDGEDNINEYMTKKTLNKKMIKEVLIKNNIRNYKPLIIDEYNLRVNMKEEKIISDNVIITKLIKATDKPTTMTRHKKRYSYLSKDKIYRYDFTIIGYNKIDEYELEIEIINPSKSSANVFLDLGIELFNIINNKKKEQDISTLEWLNPEKHAKNNKDWVLANRIGYNEKIFKTFKPENYTSEKTKLTCACDDEKCEIDDKQISLFPQQRLIKDYIQIDSPYKGALLYHELGSGKSGASIAAAEGYINKKKMFVLSPASLAVNYENEIYKISSIGLNLKKDWSLVKVVKTNTKVKEILLSKYAIDTSIIKKEGIVWIPLYENDIPNASVIKTNPNEEDKNNINLMISHIIRNRYTFISYNGLTAKAVKEMGTSPFDNSFIIIDEVHNFASRIVNGSKLARDIYTKIMSADDCKVILLSGTPVINNPFEIATIVNLIRGYMNVYSLSYSKTSKFLNEEDFIDKMKKSNLFYILDEFNIDNENKKIYVSLLPKGYTKTKEQTIIKNDWKMTIEEAIERIITGINEISGIKIITKYDINLYSALPNNKDEFNVNFIDTTDDENPVIKNKDLFIRRIIGTLSYYSISGSDLFPNRLPDITRYLDMTDTQFKKYLDVRTIERKMENAQKGLFEDKTSVYRAFSRMVCNFSFPEDIERLYPNDVKRAIKKEIDEDDTTSMTSDKSIEKKETKKVVDLYDQQLKKSIKKLLDGNNLNYDNVKNQLSPKFAYMLDDVNASPGSVLVYSQFRSVEGLGLFSEFLNENGFKEIDLKKIDGKYHIADANVFNSSYDNKRYVIFNQDKEKTKYLMNIFNGDFKSVPKEILNDIPMDINQQYGKLVKLFCITASGAEGISLKNVRRVLITEPYWNNIRIEQVIGRAIRSCSHETLPLADRNVTVYRYIMKFTKKQIEKDYSIATLDKGITTDEHISLMANKKMAIVNQFLLMLKASSFDCVINSKQNKPLQNGYKCYSWALGVNKNDLSYTPDINNDLKIMKHKRFQIEKKGKGRVIIKKGVKYVELNGKIYNYYSYKNAGILIPEEI